MNCILPNLLVITEAIMDLHLRIDSIKTIASSAVMSDPADVAYAFQQVVKEMIISEFLINQQRFGKPTSEVGFCKLHFW